MIELILAVTLFSVVLLVVVTGFFIGSRAWRKGISQSNQEYKIYFGLEKISQLIKKGIFLKTGDFYVDWLKFEGTNDSLTLAVLANPKEENTGAFDLINISQKDSNVILLSKSFEDIVEEKNGSEKKIIANVKNLSFNYGSINPDATTFTIDWSENWEFDDTLPAAIRIIVEYGQEENPETATKDVFIFS